MNYDICSGSSPQDNPLVRSIMQAQHLVMQPCSSTSAQFLRGSGFRTIPQAPLLMARYMVQDEIDELFRILLQVWPEEEINHTRFLLTDAPIDSRRLLVEFLSAQSLGMILQAKEFGWFSAVLAQRSLFFVHQPLIDLRSGAVLGHECLVRGRLDTGETLSGMQLIRAAQATQRMVEFDEAARHVCLKSIQAVLDRSLRPTSSIEIDRKRETQGRDQNTSQNMARLGRYWLNVVPNSILADPYFVENLIAILPLYRLSPQQITLELTEVEAIEETTLLTAKVAQLQQAGFAIALDDLYGAVPVKNHLMEVLPNYIKLDRQLVNECSEYHVKRIVIESLVQSAHDLGITVLAEGLETVADVECCRELGVDLGQGYGLGLPAIEPLSIGVPSPQWPFDLADHGNEPQIHPLLSSCDSVGCDQSCFNQNLIQSHDLASQPTSQACYLVYPQCSLPLSHQRRSPNLAKPIPQIATPRLVKPRANRRVNSLQTPHPATPHRAAPQLELQTPPQVSPPPQARQTPQPPSPSQQRVV